MLRIVKPQLCRHSVSKHMFERFKQHEVRRKAVAILYIALYLVYLGWRLTILNPDSMLLSVAYFAAECMGFVLGLTIITGSWNYNHREPLPTPKGLSVDILVPTYKEPLELIRRTVIAAKEIDYPHQTWILDDGRRSEVRALADELGLHYLSRPQNTHAKAGNLNYGMAHSNADFVMVFDADHIPLPHALDVTLGFFADSQVAMVQTPQDYYNTGAFQYINSKRGGLWHDQSFFYNIAQACRDTSNGVSCVGTGVVYRRSALDRIGGIPTATVTEDIHTSLKLDKAGYKAFYLNEPIAYGEAAPDLKEYYKTRHRWGHGNLHALQQENILFCKGLTFKQRMSHLALGLIYLEGWQQLLLFTIPIGTLVFGLQPFKMSIFNILIVLLFPFFNYALLQEIGCGFARFWANEIYAMARWPVQILSTAGVFGRTMPWRTTLKNIKARVHWNLMLPQLTVLVASLGAVIYAIFRLRNDFETGPLFHVLKSLTVQGRIAKDVDLFVPMPRGYTVDLVAISGFWALYNALRAGAFVRKAVRNAHQSHMFFRFPIPLPLRMAGEHYGRVSAVSETWVGFTLFGDRTELHSGDELSLTLFLPAGPLDVRIAVEKSSCNASGSTDVEANFVWGTSPETRDHLARALYSVDWHREFLNRHAYFHTPLDVLLSLLSLKWPSRPALQWRPVLYYIRAGDQPMYGVIETNSASIMTSLVAFAPLEPGHHYEGIMMGHGDTLPVGFRVIEEQPIASLVQKGLDGSVVRRYRVEGALVAKKPQPIDGHLPLAEAVEFA